MRIPIRGQKVKKRILKKSTSLTTAIVLLKIKTKTKAKTKAKAKAKTKAIKITNTLLFKLIKK